MRLFRVTKMVEQWLSEQPETRMGIEVMEEATSEGVRRLVAIGGHVIADLAGPRDTSSEDLLGQAWLSQALP